MKRAAHTQVERGDRFLRGWQHNLWAGQKKLHFKIAIPLDLGTASFSPHRSEWSKGLGLNSCVWTSSTCHQSCGKKISRILTSGISLFPSSPFDASFAIDYNLLNYLVHSGTLPPPTHPPFLFAITLPFPNLFVCNNTPAVVTQVHLLIPTLVHSVCLIWYRVLISILFPVAAPWGLSTSTSVHCPDSTILWQAAGCACFISSVGTSHRGLYEP